MTVALHHEVAGNGPPLLLGGSLGTTLKMWDPQFGPLAERLRVVRFDHRGHGGSPVPRGPYSIEDLGRDVLALMDALDMPRASYCGLSLGGIVGMWLAATAPERIDRLVVLCALAHLPPASGWHERAAAVRAAGGVDLVADTVLARWLTPRFASDRPEVAADLRAMLAASPPEGYAACCEALAELDLRPLLGRIEAPTLVVAGADDPVAAPDSVRALAEAIPGARAVAVSPGAHLVSVERPGEVTRLIVDHVQEAP